MRRLVRALLCLGLAAACGGPEEAPAPGPPGEALPASCFLAFMWRPPVPACEPFFPPARLPPVFLEGAGGLGFLSLPGRHGGPLLPVGVVRLASEGAARAALAALQRGSAEGLRFYGRGRELRLRPPADPTAIPADALGRQPWFRRSRLALGSPPAGGFLELHADPLRLLEALRAAKALRLSASLFESLGADGLLSAALRLKPDGRGGFSGPCVFELARRPKGLVGALLHGAGAAALPEPPPDGAWLALRLDPERLAPPPGAPAPLGFEGLAGAGLGALLGPLASARARRAFGGELVLWAPAAAAGSFCAAASIADEALLDELLAGQRARRTGPVRLEGLERGRGVLRFFGRRLEVRRLRGWLVALRGVSGEPLQRFLAALDRARRAPADPNLRLRFRGLPLGPRLLAAGRLARRGLALRGRLALSRR